MRHIQNVHYRKFRHIQPYSGIFRTLCNSCILKILTYLEPKNPSLSRRILAYSERSLTLSCCEPCHLQKFVIFRILAYLGPETYPESCLFRHIQVYSDILNNDNYNNINFLFFTLILHTFRRNFKRHMFFDYNDVNFNARLSLPK